MKSKNIELAQGSYYIAECVQRTWKTFAPFGLDKRVQMQGLQCAIQALMACGYLVMRHLMYSTVYYLHLILNSVVQLASPNI